MARFALSPRHRTMVRAIAGAMFEHEGGPSEAQLDAVVAAYEAHVGATSMQLRPVLLFSLDFMRWLPVLLFVAMRPFDDLPVEGRVRMLERMERSRLLPLVLSFVAYKTLLTMIFFELPEELRAMGYPGLERKRWLRQAA
ncbi:MAG TPA: hypothetical protein VF765_14670 [Polyangiaceae bacterium]